MLLPAVVSRWQKLTRNCHSARLHQVHLGLSICCCYVWTELAMQRGPLFKTRVKCWDPQMKTFILGISTGLFLNKHVSYLPQRKLWTELIPHSPPDLYT